jgi:hypothetical protein
MTNHQLDEEILRRRDKDSFDAGFSAGIGWALSEANEPLIAAAPELLEALKQIERETIDHVAVKIARTAIAKAEGK